MATYIQGVTDYLPQIQPFQPDLNFLGNILQTKQSRYDAAHKQLSNVYGTMLNSPMLRDKNINNRDNFFKMIQQDIHKMSGVDLSLQQNVDSAQQVFKALYDDQDIVKDMTVTRNIRNQKERGAAFKLCVDLEKCGGGWWEGGDQYLDYKAQEFKNATDEDARNFGDVEYVPYQNFQKDALKWAKDMGFEIKYDDFSRAPGYISHIKNGEAMIQPLAKHFLSVFGSDPKYTKYFEALAFNTRKGWVNAKAGEYNSEEEASLAYMEQFYTTINNQVKENKKQADEDSDVAQAKLIMAEKNAAEQGIQGDENNWLAQLNGYKEQVESINKVKDIYTDAENTLSNMNINASNINLYLSNFDKMMGLQMLERESINASSAYANLTTEITYDVDAKQLAASERSYNEQKAIMEEGYVKYDQNGNPVEYVPGRKAMKEAWLENIKNGGDGTGVTGGGGSHQELIDKYKLSGTTRKLTAASAGTQEGTIDENIANNTNVAKANELKKEDKDAKGLANNIILTRLRSSYLNEDGSFQKANTKGTLVEIFHSADKSKSRRFWDPIIKGFLNDNPDDIAIVEDALKIHGDVIYKHLSEIARPSKMSTSNEMQISTVLGTSFSDITSDETYLTDLTQAQLLIQEVDQAKTAIKSIQKANNDVTAPIFKAQNPNLKYKDLIPKLVQATEYGTYSAINSPFTKSSLGLDTPASHSTDNWTSLLSSFYKTSRGKIISDTADKQIEEYNNSTLLKQLNVQPPKLIYKKTETDLDKVNKFYLGKNTATWTPIEDKDGTIAERLIAFEDYKNNKNKYYKDVNPNDDLLTQGKKIINNLAMGGSEIGTDYFNWATKRLKSNLNIFKLRPGESISIDTYIEEQIDQYKFGTAKDKVAFDVIKEYNNDKTKKSWLSAYAEKANSWIDPNYSDFRERSTSEASMAFSGTFTTTDPDSNTDFLALMQGAKDADAEGVLELGRGGDFHDKEKFDFNKQFTPVLKERITLLEDMIYSQLYNSKLAKNNPIIIDYDVSPNISFYKKGYTAVKIKIPYSIYSKFASTDEVEKLFMGGTGAGDITLLYPNQFLPPEIKAKVTGTNDDLAAKGNEEVSYPVPDGGVYTIRKNRNSTDPNNVTYTVTNKYFEVDPENPGKIKVFYGKPQLVLGDADLKEVKNRNLNELQAIAQVNRQNPNYRKKVN